MSNRETVLMREIMVALSGAGCFVLRTNSGVYYSKNGTPVTVGFPGLSDLIGCTPSGQFFALEIKTPVGRATQEQKDFIKAMKTFGALAGFARSVEDALKIVERRD